MSSKISDVAHAVASKVREYVRDNFELREKLDLTPLDDLVKFVEERVTFACSQTRGLFVCIQCNQETEVERVRCSKCTLEPR